MNSTHVKRLVRSVRISFVCLLLAASFQEPGAGPIDLGPTHGIIATAINSDPDRIPTIGVWQWSSEVVFIYAEFPNIPGARTDGAVYESYTHALTGYLDVSVKGEDRIEIKHRYFRHPQILHVGTVTAEPGAVTMTGSLELDPDSENLDDPLPESLWAPDVCFQLRYSEPFWAYSPIIDRNSVSHASQYHDYIRRCFIFTEDGLTFLDKTVRNEFASTVGWKQDDPRDHPPITQRHLGVWQGDPPDWMKYVSPDRYVAPVMGTVSRDGKSLMALAGVSPDYMQQALFECLHNYSRWLPEDAPLLERVWTRKIYAMENDPDALLEKVYQDIHNIEKPE